MSPRAQRWSEAPPAVLLEEILPDCLNELGLGRASIEELAGRYPEHSAQLVPLLELAERFWNAPRTPPQPGTKERLRQAVRQRRDRALGRLRDALERRREALSQELAARWAPIQEALDRFVAGEYSLRELLLVVAAQTWLLLTRLGAWTFQAARRLRAERARRAHRLPGASVLPSLPRPTLRVPGAGLWRRPTEDASEGPASEGPASEVEVVAATPAPPRTLPAPAVTRQVAPRAPRAARRPAWRRVGGSVLRLAGAALLLVGLAPYVGALLPELRALPGELSAVSAQGRTLPTLEEAATDAQETAGELSRLTKSEEGRVELGERTLRNSRWAAQDLMRALERRRAAWPLVWEELMGELRRRSRELLARLDLDS